jgi:TolB-like protein/Flp pilus assembly protein TadD
VRPGDLLDDRVVIERPAGSGGGGVVFRARDLSSGAPLAVKVVRSEAAADRRFEREAAALAALRHPGIVAYVGHGRVGDELYLVMEWLEGEDLATRLSRAELGMGETLAVGRQLAAALAAAHAAGIVHRDVKPSNVFLVGGRTDAVKLLDFGVARRAGAATLTTAGMLVGTPIYMAPEQARGSRELDARVDVYALGALLHRLVARRPPAGGGSLEEVVARILAETPQRLAALAPGVPRGLDALVARMLAKDPGRRPADGAAVAVALADLDAVAPEPSATDAAFGDTLEARPREVAIAVLPFVDLSAAGDQGWFCDGVAEELIHALSQIAGLRVAARSSSFREKGRDAREAGARLGAQAVLEGGVRRAGDRLRVTVQLVDVASGSPRWSHRFDGGVADVFAVQDDIAAGVATALRGILSQRDQEAMRRPGTSAEAYQSFLRGREQLHRVSVSSYRAAVEQFQHAIDIDPRYAPAYAGLAQMHCRFYEWAGGDAAALEAGDRASKRALELAPTLAEAHVARGHFLKVIRRYDEAEQAFREAVRINGSSYDAHIMWARTCFQRGHIAASEPLFRRAAALNPEDVQASLLHAQALRKLGRDDEALAGNRDAIARAERQLAFDPDDARTLSLVCTALWMVGESERARRAGERAIAVASDDPAVWYNVACLYALSGEHDRALVYLEKALVMGGGREWIQHDPDFESLRGDARFGALLARMA